MNKMGIIIFGALLAGCSADRQPVTPETLSPTDYKKCIEAAMEGNGQQSNEACAKVTRDTR